MRWLLSEPSACKLCRPMGTISGRSRIIKRAYERTLTCSSSPSASEQAGTSALPTDFRSASTVEKGHGRLEKRTIIVRSLLADYSTWPELAQVFKLESQRTDALGRTKTEVRYGVTSLPAALADPKRLLELTRGQWGIENGLHYRRDATLGEDHSQLRMGHAPQLFAALNNTALGLLARQG
jgi:predicted transposase YbfD/YdcC